MTSLTRREECSRGILPSQLISDIQSGREVCVGFRSVTINAHDWNAPFPIEGAPLDQISHPERDID